MFLTHSTEADITHSCSVSNTKGCGFTEPGKVYHKTAASLSLQCDGVSPCLLGGVVSYPDDVFTLIESLYDLGVGALA